jgi:hypothetical protein
MHLVIITHNITNHLPISVVYIHIIGTFNILFLMVLFAKEPFFIKENIYLLSLKPTTIR